MRPAVRTAFLLAAAFSSPVFAEEAAAPPRSIIRFLTDTDYAPFNYLDEDGVLTGFNVDVARAICLDLDVACDVRGGTWQRLLADLGRGDADAVIASIAITPTSLEQADFTDRYYAMPARFAAVRGAAELDPTPEGLEGSRIGVVKGTAHEAYLQTYYRDSVIVPFPSADAAREALKSHEIDVLFGDGTSMVFWLNGTSSNGCCELRGGPFYDSQFFGDGVGIAVRKGDSALQAQINRALQHLRASGRLEELYLRYFPIRVY